MLGQIRLYHQENYAALSLAITGNYADCPNMPLHVPTVIDVPALLRSIRMVWECEVTPIPDHWIARTWTRRGGRKARKTMQSSVTIVGAGPEYQERVIVAGMTASEEASLDGGVGMSVGDGEVPLSFYDDDL